MAKQILTGLDLLALPSLTTPKTGSVGFGAKSDGLYQKIGTVESKLSTTAELLDRVKTPVPEGAKFTDTNTTYTAGTNVQISAANVISATDTKYSLPTASGTTLGGIKVGSRLSINSGTLSATQQTANDFTTVLKNKLDNIASNANNYTHPSSHSISFITGLQDALDGKSATGHTHSNITITAGTGLSGGGALSASRTLSIASTYAPNTSTSLGASKNLNNYQTAGFYHQTANANATTALNYPVASAGSLLVETAAGVVQTYKVYNSSDVYVRGFYSTTWSAWRKLVNASDSIPWARISGAPTTATTHPTWAQVTGKPSTFTPSSHTHTSAQISDATSANTASRVVVRNASGNFSAGTITATLSGNASTATTATKLGTATVGSTQLPFYLNAGTATAITQDNLRKGLFGTTAIGSATKPVYIAANGVPTASTSFGGVTGIGTASPLVDGTVAVGTSTLAARQDHRHPVDTSRAAAGQTMYIGTTAVKINRASGALALSGISTLAMTGALSGATTITATTSVKAPKVSVGNSWSLELSGTELQIKYGGVVKQRMLSDGTFVAEGGLSALGLGEGGGSTGGGGTTVYDGLTSNATDVALSANQGRLLNLRLQVVENSIPTHLSQLTNDLTTFPQAITVPAIYKASDISLKKDIKNINSEKIDGINLIEFVWKETNQKDYGVIAQELKVEYPELVREDSEGIMQVNYESLYALKIARLEQRIKELESKKCQH